MLGSWLARFIIKLHLTKTKFPNLKTSSEWGGGYTPLSCTVWNFWKHLFMLQSVAGF